MTGALIRQGFRFVDSTLSHSLVGQAQFRKMETQAASSAADRLENERPAKRLRISPPPATESLQSAAIDVEAESFAASCIRKQYRYVPDYGTGLHLAPMVRYAIRRDQGV